MAEYRYYLIPDKMSIDYPSANLPYTPVELYESLSEVRSRFLQLRENPYNNEFTWNPATQQPYSRLTVGLSCTEPQGSVEVVHVQAGINYLTDGYQDESWCQKDTPAYEMMKGLVEAVGAERIIPHKSVQRDGTIRDIKGPDVPVFAWPDVHDLCRNLKFTQFLNIDGQMMFHIRDGQRVLETRADGTQMHRVVTRIDITHARVGNHNGHIQRYANLNFQSGCYVAPEHPQPGDNLDKLQIYQITKGGCEYRFMDYDYSKSRIHAADYSSVYIANLPADYDLERCFQEFNAPNRPLRYHMCSLSTSDIVVTTKSGKETAYYVDSIGFKDVSHLLPELHEVEAQRQKEQVQDEPER